MFDILEKYYIHIIVSIVLFILVMFGLELKHKNERKKYYEQERQKISLKNAYSKCKLVDADYQMMKRNDERNKQFGTKFIGLESLSPTDLKEMKDIMNSCTQIESNYNKQFGTKYQQIHKSILKELKKH